MTTTQYAALSSHEHTVTYHNLFMGGSFMCARALGSGCVRQRGLPGASMCALSSQATAFGAPGLYLQLPMYEQKQQRSEASSFIRPHHLRR